MVTLYLENRLNLFFKNLEEKIVNSINGGKIDKDSADNKAKDNQQRDEDVEELQKGIKKDDSQNKEEDLLKRRGDFIVKSKII